jgi:hypothetical protein
MVDLAELAKGETFDLHFFQKFSVLSQQKSNMKQVGPSGNMFDTYLHFDLSKRSFKQHVAAGRDCLLSGHCLFIKSDSKLSNIRSRAGVIQAALHLMAGYCRQLKSDRGQRVEGAANEFQIMLKEAVAVLCVAGVCLLLPWVRRKSTTLGQ